MLLVAKCRQNREIKCNQARFGVKNVLFSETPVGNLAEGKLYSLSAKDLDKAFITILLMITGV
jgi:hypothetical protein